MVRAPLVALPPETNESIDRTILACQIVPGEAPKFDGDMEYNDVFASSSD